MAGHTVTERRPWRKLYGRRWRNARASHLQREALCRMCLSKGDVTPATVVDHVKAHRGDVSLFWDQGNWQSLCDMHHNRHKQREESVEARSQHVQQCGVDGFTKGDSW